ncbi:MULTISPECIES: hypothetical protein [unclassified Flavobacterium]|jgi:hypothetical protein|uniref:hypothetical protein n=1 Tax=unclassified Flavobacterium TaxID=196869 RepID=UPI0024931AC4|nr:MULTISPECIES: hypothetical protein [unclassified Flavobacterium]MDQ1163886.1 hypothetical protein [Flavobacterium sp. SORGH_AS_0622]BDU24455.1 hypothetical protein FLGSB24_11990 [Flavobacterium sp. GSB-24]
MKFITEIIFGKEQITKYYNNQSFDDFEKVINVKKYTFETQSERNAFYRGMAEAVGWLEFEVIKEFEENNHKVVKEKEEDKFDYWSFIEKFYPRYYQCNSVLLSNILTKKLDGEEISENDKKYIKGSNVRKELLEIDKELLCKAFENYFNTIYPEN